MAEQRVSLAQLTDLLRERAAALHARNLVLAALPLETAHRDARQLARDLGAEYLNFDCELLARMEADDWEDHVALERRGTLSIGQMLARDWLIEMAGRVNRGRPLVIGNVNLAVRYEIDVAQAFYDATERGLCVLAAGGRLQGQTLLVHGVLPPADDCKARRSWCTACCRRPVPDHPPTRWSHRQTIQSTTRRARCRRGCCKVECMSGKNRIGE